MIAASVWMLHAGARFGLADDELEATYRDAERVATVTDNKSVLAIVRSAYGVTRVLAGGPIEETIACRRQAQELARQAGNLELQVSLGPGIFLTTAGRNREALAEIDRVLAMGGDDYQLGRQVIGVSALILVSLYRARALTELGRLADASAALEDTLRLSREHDDLECLAYSLSGQGLLSFFTGEPGDAIIQVNEGVELGERLGSSVTRIVTHLFLSLGHLARGEHADAAAIAGKALKLMRTARTGLAFEGDALGVVATARLRCEDSAGARSAAAAGAAVASRRGLRVQEAWCRATLGRALVPSRPDEARIELNRALELAGDDGAGYVPHILLGFADHAARERDDDERLRRLEQALRVFQQQGATGHARRVAAQIPRARGVTS